MNFCCLQCLVLKRDTKDNSQTPSSRCWQLHIKQKISRDTYCRTHVLLECAEGLGEHRGPGVPHTDWGRGMWVFPKNASSPKWQGSVCWRVSRKWAHGWSSQLSSQKKKKKKKVWWSLVCTGKIADSQTASSVCPPSAALWSVTLQTRHFILCTLYISSNLLSVSSFQPVFLSSKLFST